MEGLACLWVCLSGGKGDTSILMLAKDPDSSQQREEAMLAGG